MSIPRKKRKCNCKGKHHSGACKRKRGVSSSSRGQVAAQRKRAAWRDTFDYGTIDGEAIGENFVLLACSDGSCVENPDGLRTVDCLEFITGRAYKTLWGFAFDYDVNQILNGLTITQLTRLSHTNRTYYGEFRIHHIPGKMFRITNRRTEKTVTVWDAFSFIRSSFAQWLKDWKLVGRSDLAFIKRMKDKRSTFGPDEFDEIKRYCFMELDYLDLGVRELLERIKVTEIKPRSWYSPGSVSAEVMREKKIEDHFPDLLLPEISTAAKAAYFGGRFETRIIGSVAGPLYHYDINSAYPYALTQLRCLKCGLWEHVKYVDPQEPGNLLLITWGARPFRDPHKRRPWGPFPVRLGSGSLRYPLINETPSWYWSDEVYAARHFTNIKIHSAYRFTPGCEDRPFDFIRDLYDLRRELKRQGDAAEYTYKLVINSCYGKLAQRPRRGKIPRFYQPLYAGRVTALCRAQMLEAMGQDPDAILQTATDGLTSFKQLDLPLSNNLGDWGVKMLDKILIIQSGIYFWADEKGKMLQRSRGFHPKTMTYDSCLDAWQSHPEEAMVFTNRRFVGYRTALHRGQMDTWRSWQDYPVHISMQPEPRREALAYVNGYLVSVPPVRAEPYIYDSVFEPDFSDLRAWEGEQPDGPEGGYL